MSLLARLTAAVLVVAAFGAGAQELSPEAKQQELKRLENDLANSRERHATIERQQKELEAEIDNLRDQLVLAGRSATDNETALSSLEIALADLQKDAGAKREALNARRGELIELTAAAQRLALHPPETMILLPQPPDTTIRTALALRDTFPILRTRMDTLRDELDELRRVEVEVRRQRDKVDASIRGLAKERGSIAGLLKRKQDLEKKLSAEEKKAEQRIAALTDNAKDLRDLIEKLIAERIAEEKRRQEEAARRTAQRLPAVVRPDLGDAVIARDASRTMPASGRITAAFGQVDTLGSTTRGITIETRPEATIVAPSSGRILFAGPFRGYGLILIVEHSDGYHSLLAGLGRIDTSVGKAVKTGEPVGAMGAVNKDDTGLYYELRRNGQPTDPRPWIAAQRAR